MLPVEFFNNERARLQDPYITVDIQGRIYLSVRAQELLGCVGTPAHFYVGYDPVNKRIGLAKPELLKLTDTNAYKFNGVRAYASCRMFLEKNGLMPNGAAVRYIYDGQEYGRQGVHLFRKEGASALDEPQKPTRGRGRPSRAEQLAKQEAAKAAEETAVATDTPDTEKESAE